MSAVTPRTTVPTADQDIIARSWRDSRAKSGFPFRRIAAGAPYLLLAAGAAATAMGVASLGLTSLEALSLPLFGLLGLSLAALVAHIRLDQERWDRGAILLLSGVIAGATVWSLTPEYIYGHEINGIVHRSLLTSIIMLALGLPALSQSLYLVLGATPTAQDRARYPYLLLPIAGALTLYAAILARLITDGAPGLGLDLITREYSVTLGTGGFVMVAGLRNQVLGTFLLIAMTAGLALPIGVGAGVYMAEYPGRLSVLIRFSTLLLRAISVFILGVTAFTLADWSSAYPVGDLRSDLLRGYYTDDQGFKIAGHGSYVTAAIVLSLLVIPVIARTTEEGFRSVPREVREGSLALGATEGHGFLRILLPWATPNIITGLLLGCAEAAGSVAVLLFIAGSGEFGVGPFREVTTLAFSVYYADRGVDRKFTEAMGSYETTAALLLIMLTFALSIGALLLKQRFSKRYRGAS
jgi:ABC-type phosphate transport system permease subunit